MMIYLLFLLFVNTGYCVKSYILSLQAVFIYTTVNFDPEMITTTLVNVITICVLWPWDDLGNIGH